MVWKITVKTLTVSTHAHTCRFESDFACHNSICSVELGVTRMPIGCKLVFRTIIVSMSGTWTCHDRSDEVMSNICANQTFCVGKWAVGVSDFIRLFTGLAEEPRVLGLGLL